jgi:hypothetical protein
MYLDPGGSKTRGTGGSGFGSATLIPRATFWYRSWIRIRNPKCKSGFRIRNESVIWIRNPESGIRIRNPNPESRTGIRFRNPESESGIRILIQIHWSDWIRIRNTVFLGGIIIPDPESKMQIRIPNQECESGIRIRNPESESGIRIRNSNPESESGIRIRNPNPESEFGILIRNPNPESESGIWIRNLNPESESGIQIRNPNPDPDPLIWLNPDPKHCFFWEEWLF